jgi:hypothetical protein
MRKPPSTQPGLIYSTGVAGGDSGRRKGDGGHPKMDRQKMLMAARNNAAWCAAVCGAHGHPGRLEPELWLSEHPVPRFYPNLVTLSEDVSAAEQQIDRLLAGGLTGAWAVKDSFAVLDLAGRGFQRLFEAQWLWQASPATVAAPDPAWTRVTKPEQLVTWEAAWSGEAGPTTVPTFPSSLLEDPNVAFIQLEHENRIIAGVAAQFASGAVGLTNLFADALATPQLSAAIALLARSFPQRPLVSYEPTANLAQARALGFETTGPLHVWIRSSG